MLGRIIGRRPELGDLQLLYLILKILILELGTFCSPREHAQSRESVLSEEVVRVVEGDALSEHHFVERWEVYHLSLQRH